MKPIMLSKVRTILLSDYHIGQPLASIAIADCKMQNKILYYQVTFSVICMVPPCVGAGA